jgi:uncharacterized membrane protein
MHTTDRLEQAKRPRSLLAGPYGHPFHAVSVTIPIGAWTASLVFDVLALFAADPEPFVVGARVLVVIGLVGAVVAAVLGFLDLSMIAPATPARSTALIHMAINLAVIAVFAVAAVLRFVAPTDGAQILPMTLGVIALLALGVSGWLGGKLAYRYGIRVASEEVQRREGFLGS